MEFEVFIDKDVLAEGAITQAQLAELRATGVNDDVHPPDVDFVVYPGRAGGYAVRHMTFGNADGAEHFVAQVVGVERKFVHAEQMPGT